MPSLLRALVTGATGGIGRATCFALNEAARARGLELTIAVSASKPGPALDTLVEELNEAGARTTGLTANLADAADCEQLAAQSIAACGGLDVLVSNAGVMRSAPLAQLSLADWELVFDVDVRATWLLARAAHDALAASCGCLVAVGSVSALFPFPGLGGYSPAKAAVISMTECLAAEWGPAGVRVNAVAPGYTLTPLLQEAIDRGERSVEGGLRNTPLGRMVLPEQVADAVAFLLSSRAAAITGVNLPVDGGWLVGATWDMYGGLRERPVSGSTM
jgi:glucose 1-dehydrogenase